MQYNIRVIKKLFMPQQANSTKLILEHEMFILDANLQKKLDQITMNQITNALIADILAELKMEKLGPLAIYNATDPRAPGWSFIQPITTSHISGHYFVEPDGSNPNIHMDFYSCSSFTWQSIIPIIDKHLSLGLWHGDFLYRKDISADRKIWEISGKGIDVVSEKMVR